MSWCFSILCSEIKVESDQSHRIFLLTYKMAQVSRACDKLDEDERVLQKVTHPPEPWQRAELRSKSSFSRICAKASHLFTNHFNFHTSILKWSKISEIRLNSRNAYLLVICWQVTVHLRSWLDRMHLSNILWPLPDKHSSPTKNLRALTHFSTLTLVLIPLRQKIAYRANFGLLWMFVLTP